MLHNDIFPVVFGSIYLFIYSLLMLHDTTSMYGYVMFLFSPFIVCWMLYTILKHGKYTGRELGENEFGYQDKDNKELGMF